MITICIQEVQVPYHTRKPTIFIRLPRNTCTQAAIKKHFVLMKFLTWTARDISNKWWICNFAYRTLKWTPIFLHIHRNTTHRWYRLSQPLFSIPQYCQRARIWTAVNLPLSDFSPVVFHMQVLAATSHHVIIYIQFRVKAQTDFLIKWMWHETWCISTYITWHH